MEPIDITMTAVPRPDIIEKTLYSFLKNMFGDYPIRLIFNLDPVGDVLADPKYVGQFLSKIVPNYSLRMPDRPHFGRAFYWCWSEARSKYVFNLEDDWECLKPVVLEAMINAMDDNPDLALLRLPWIACGGDKYNSWGVRFPWNGLFFECPPDERSVHGFCGHPSLIRLGFIQEVLQYLNPDLNPEKQIKGHNPNMWNILKKWRFGVWGYPACQPTIKDLGREWKRQNGWDKHGNPAVFTVWRKLDESPCNQTRDDRCKNDDNADHGKAIENRS